MHALVYTDTETLEYKEFKNPTLIKGESIIKVHASGICGSDMHAYHGKDERRIPPLILGHEISGTIFEGKETKEVCIDKKTNKIIMQVNEKFYRPLEVDYLQGDYSKINSTLGWKPETSIDQIIEKMVCFDLENFNNNVFYI